MEVPKKSTELLHGPAIPPLGIWPKDGDSRILSGFFTSMFIAASFTVAKARKEPNGSGWMDKEGVLYLYRQ